MNDFTFLTKEQIEGKKIFNIPISRPISIIRKRGKQAQITDWAIVSGGNYSNEPTGVYGDYWVISDKLKEGFIESVSYDGAIKTNTQNSREIGTRLVLPISSISNIPTNGQKPKRAEDGLLEVEYGYQPDEAPVKDIQDTLEQAYLNGIISKLKGEYTTDKNYYYERQLPFEPKKLGIYEYNGERYVRTQMKGRLSLLSNGQQYEQNDIVWIRVKPIKWIIDEKELIMVTESVVFAGVPFNAREKKQKNNFENSDLNIFLNTYYIREITQREVEYEEYVEIKPEKEEVEEGELVKKANPYNLDLDEVDEEEIIRGAVKAGVAVFLHGRSSEGKSARVKQIDPGCVMVYLGLSNSPDKFIGKSVYNQASGEMMDIKPSWIVKLEEKCRNEPDKLHIVFLEELTNASPTIQGLVYDLVLERELDGKWKLPKNARIVAAGNEQEDSTIAEEMPAPLYNRFAHVYIKTTLEKWLKWASTATREDGKPTIHPSVYAYIAFKGESVLRTEYNGKTPNADPRKWEMASKILYETKRPEMLRALIGEVLSKDFTEFCRQKIITLDDIIAQNYSNKDLEINLSEKYALAASLTNVGEENLEEVRNFLSKLGREPLAIFDSLWCRGDVQRLEKIAELRAEEYFRD